MKAEAISALLVDMLRDTSVELPADPEACLECKHHPSNFKFEGDKDMHCSVFKDLPPTLCLKFTRVIFTRRDQ